MTDFSCIICEKKHGCGMTLKEIERWELGEGGRVDG
jgi:hypothetical protein